MAPRVIVASLICNPTHGTCTSIYPKKNWPNTNFKTPYLFFFQIKIYYKAKSFNSYLEITAGNNKFSIMK